MLEQIDDLIARTQVKGKLSLRRHSATGAAHRQGGEMSVISSTFPNAHLVSL